MRLDAAQGFAAGRENQAEERTQAPQESQSEGGECRIAGEIGEMAQETREDGHGEDSHDHDHGIGGRPQALPEEREPGAPHGSGEFRIHALMILT